jgi:hypothetical protein
MVPHAGQDTMTVKRIESNDDLEKYLLELSTELRSCGRDATAEQVHHASLFAQGSASEFLYEAEKALKEVQRTCVDVLPEMVIAQVARVLRQITEAFDRVGGA